MDQYILGFLWLAAHSAPVPGDVTNMYVRLVDASTRLPLTTTIKGDPQCAGVVDDRVCLWGRGTFKAINYTSQADIKCHDRHMTQSKTAVIFSPPPPIQTSHTCLC